MDRMGFDLVIASFARAAGRGGFPVRSRLRGAGTGPMTCSGVGITARGHLPRQRGTTRSCLQRSRTPFPRSTPYAVCRPKRSGLFHRVRRQDGQARMEVVDAIPTGAKMVRAWDVAATAGESADFTGERSCASTKKRWTVCVTWFAIKSRVARSSGLRDRRPGRQGVNIVLER